jgi:NAD(P)-dependent dehydrogenase (short-subunit alcohol dehydrogenase family)
LEHYGPPMEIAGSNALVTGGAAGIGQAIAAALADAGAQVLVGDVDEEVGRATAGAIGGAFVRLDVTRDEELRSAVAAAAPLGILVNNAGGVGSPNFPEAPVERWSAVLDLNLRSLMLATQVAVAAMRGRGGAIVNVSSIAGVGTGPYDAPEYAAAKAGVMRLTSSLGTLAAEGIRVNCLCPDWVDTPAVRRSLAELPPEERAAIEPHLVPAERVAEAALRFVRDESLAGRILVCPRDGEWELLPVR